MPHMATHLSTIFTTPTLFNKTSNNFFIQHIEALPTRDERGIDACKTFASSSTVSSLFYSFFLFKN